MAFHPQNAAWGIRMKVIPYNPVYLDAVRSVHLATASERARTDMRHQKYSLWMYCDEYLEKETAFVLLNDSDEVCGYILCAEDADTWAENMKPYEEQIQTLGSPYPEMISGQIEEYRMASELYPAHMHIDILEEYTGKGSGKLLMETLLAHLKNNNVRGICLGVAKKNERAFGFYRHFGFEILAEDESGAFLGKKL